MSLQATSPATLFGGTWTAIAGQFLLGAGGAYPAGSTGGEAAHALTETEMPSHNHGVQQAGFGWRYTYANGQRWYLSGRKLPVLWHKRKAFCRIYDFNFIHRRKRSAQQHAAVAGRLPLEARGISYAARKGAAV